MPNPSCETATQGARCQQLCARFQMSEVPNKYVINVYSRQCAHRPFSIDYQMLQMINECIAITQTVVERVNSEHQRLHTDEI